MPKVTITDDHIIMELKINIREYLARFGGMEVLRSPEQRRWIKGKLKQEFTKQLDQTFGPDGKLGGVS